jgi:hypothetical protein
MRHLSRGDASGSLTALVQPGPGHDGLLGGVNPQAVVIHSVTRSTAVWPIA